MPSSRPFLLFALLLSSGGALHAQADAEDPIHWAYGAYFGTGAYRLADGEKAYIVSARPRWQIRDAALDEQGRRQVGVVLRFPVAIGAYDFDASAIGQTLGLDNVGTLSVVPGVEIDIPMSARWSLKPLAYGGWGTELDGDASAWMYWTGIKSRLRFPGADTSWALVNALTYVGYSTNAGEHGNSLPLFTGFEFDRPLGAKKLADEQVVLHWHVGYTSYLNGLELFRDSNFEHLDLDGEWELGIAFGTGEEPLRLWRLKWDRVGIAYRFSRDGDFAGIGLVFHSLFER
jgi:hypothetical protein